MKHIILFLFLIPTYLFGQWQWRNLEYNNGEIWEVNDLYFFDSLKGIAVGHGYSPLLTWDGGMNWFYPQGLNYLINGKLYFLNNGVGFCYGWGRNLKTTDFGESWRNVDLQGLCNYSYMHFANDSVGYIIGKQIDSEDGKIFRTSDCGETWIDISFDKNYYYLSVCFFDSDNGWIYGSNSIDGIFRLRTSDGGKNWTKSLTNNLFKQIQPIDNLTGYTLSWGAGKLLKTTDAGNLWIETPMPESYYEINSLFFINENIGYIGGCAAKGDYGYGTIYKTTDGCKTWTIVYDAEISSTIRYIFFADENNGWASTGYGILRTTNGGITFTPDMQSAEISESLISNYPNPFNGYTTIQYTLREAGTVKIYLYDMLGREMKQLVNEYKSAGEYKLSFNAGDLPSGTYYYCLNTGDFVQYKSMLLLK